MCQFKVCDACHMSHSLAVDFVVKVKDQLTGKVYGTDIYTKLILSLLSSVLLKQPL
jgi:hypothetical protein